MSDLLFLFTPKRYTEGSKQFFLITDKTARIMPMTHNVCYTTQYGALFCHI